jgi:hypothetical protein
MAKMQLFGGELDGWEKKNVSPAARPDVFYGIPRDDEEKIKAVRSPSAKQELKEKLAVLAYKYDEETSTANHYKMRRCCELDRVTSG